MLSQNTNLIFRSSTHPISQFTLFQVSNFRSSGMNV